MPMDADPTAPAADLGAGEGIDSPPTVDRMLAQRGLFEAAFDLVAGDALLVDSHAQVLYVAGKAGGLFQRPLAGSPALTLDEHLADPRLAALLRSGLGALRAGEQEVVYAHDGILGPDHDRIRIRALQRPRRRMNVALVEFLQSSQVPAERLPPAVPVEQVLGPLEGPAVGLQRYLDVERENALLRQLVDEAAHERTQARLEVHRDHAELLAAREELLRANDELERVNRELMARGDAVERQQARLAAAERDATALLAGSGVASLLLDDDLRLRRHAPHAVAYFPVSAADVGRPIEELRTRLPLDLQAAAEAVRASGKPWQADLVVDGSEHVRVTMTPCAPVGNRASAAGAGFVLTIFPADTDARAAGQAEQLAIERAIGVARWAWPDTSRDDLEVSPVFHERLGHSPVQWPATLPAFVSMIHPDDANRVSRAVQQARQTEEPFSCEFRMRDASGRWRWCLASGCARRDAQGRQRMDGINLELPEGDRSRRSAADGDGEGARGSAMHQDRLLSLGVLASGMAHELNNPLAAIRVGAEQLRKLMPVDESGRAPMPRILERQLVCVDRMQSIIDSLLVYSRNQPAHLRTVCHLADIVRDVASLTRPLAGELDAALQVEMPPAQWRLRCNPIEISQVLINLVTNSLHAIAGMPQRWVRLQVALAGDGYELRTTDSGRTADIPTPEHLFTPFYSTKSVGKGTGLGLTISRRIADAHGGSLALDAAAAHTTFVLRLPRGDLDAAAAGREDPA